jgi:hypothetical protein
MGPARGRARAILLALFLLPGPAARGQEPETAPDAGWLQELLRGVQQLLPGSSAPPASAEEAGRVFDAFLTFVVKRAARESIDLGLREDFLAALLDGRHDAVSLVAGEIGLEEDALRELLATSWPRVQPLLAQLVAELGDERGATYQDLIDAARALLSDPGWGALQQLALSPEALRELAAIVAPEGGLDPLAYDDSLDPELRELFGFGAPLAPPLDNPALEPDVPVFPPPLAARLIWALEEPAAIEFGPQDELTTLAQRLNGWVAKPDELDAYLPATRRLLQLSADGTLATRALDAEFHELFRNLVLATAWKESCWRQFVLRRGKLQTIASSVGAVGIMQVYARVWRGFYEVDGLKRDAGYNARAGSEILHHYLRDYAIRKGEHVATGNADNLARAAYAIYNGGPSQMRRYRIPPRRRSLRAIDASFWEKYQAVKAGDSLGVARCYGDAG